jgi:hypothetical protein
MQTILRKQVGGYKFCVVCHGRKEIVNKPNNSNQRQMCDRGHSTVVRVCGQKVQGSEFSSHLLAPRGGSTIPPPMAKLKKHLLPFKSLSTS